MSGGRRGRASEGPCSCAAWGWLVAMESQLQASCAAVTSGLPGREARRARMWSSWASRCLCHQRWLSLSGDKAIGGKAEPAPVQGVREPLVSGH